VSVSLPRRDRVLIVSCLAALILLPWAYLIHLDRGMQASMAEADAMAKMGMSSDAAWTTKDVLVTFIMRGVMMVVKHTSPVLPAFAA
jgi:predicted metal-binding membrane protein